MNTTDNKPSLLVCVQAVDLDDSLMGFFVPWLEEAAKQFGQVTVLALRVGRYELPGNVTVLPFRKGTSRSRLLVVWTLLKQSWIRRGSYDAVFVRGDPQYVLASGWLWRLLGKKVVFWYAHYQVSLWAKLASYIASTVVSSSRAASIGLQRVTILGQGIDTRRFPFIPRLKLETLNCLTFGRMDESKRIDFIIRAFKDSQTAIPTSLTFVGPPAFDAERQTIIQRQASDDARIDFQTRRVAYTDVPALFSRYTVLLNATSASLDKTIIEACLSGVIPLACTPALREWLPEDLQWLQVTTEQDMARALARCSQLSDSAYADLVQRLHDAAAGAHALTGQVTRLKAVVDE